MTNNLPLFRKEALDAREAQFLGTIVIGKNANFGTIACVACFFGTLLVAYTLVGTYTRKARLPGILVPAQGSLTIPAPFTGVVTRINSKEGDIVSAGQELLSLNIDHSTSNGQTSILIAESLEQRRQTLETEERLTKLQSEQRQKSYSNRIRSMSNEQLTAEADVNSLHERLDLAKRSVERYEELASKGYVPAIQAQQKQEELIDLQSRLTAAVRTLSTLKRDTDALAAEKEDNAATANEQITQIHRNIASLQQEIIENHARGALSITAPKTGTLVSVLVHVGSTVQANQTIATVVPNDGSSEKLTTTSTLDAELYAPSKSAGFIAAGQTVWMRYAAYNYQKFGMARGEVMNVSSVPLGPQDLPTGQGQALLNAVQSNEPLYRVTVKINSQDIKAYGSSQKLKPGLALEADVLQDKRYIWEWIFDPLRAMVYPSSFQNIDK